MSSVTTASLGFLTGDPVGALLAHQGGWDEMLMVAVPVIVFALLLRMASKRADRLEPASAESDSDDRSSGGPDSSDPVDGSPVPTSDPAPTDTDG